MDDLQRLTEMATLSDDFKGIMQSRAYDLINTHVFDRMYQRAFETFKKVKADDTTAIIETQMIGKVIELVRREFEIIVAEGDAARVHLANINNGGINEY